MSQSTVYLRDLMNNPETKVLLQNAMSTYPLYEKKSKEEFIPSYIPTREELNLKILNHYKYHEIGFETVGRFIDELEISLNEIMPSYNLLFYSADQDYKILENVGYTRTIDTDREGTVNNTLTGNSTASNTLTESNESTNTGTESNTSTDTDNVEATNTTTNTKKQVETQTPQNEINVPAESIDNVSYADSVKWDKESNSNSGQSTSTKTGNRNVESETTTSGTSTQNGTTTGEVSNITNGATTDKELRTETTKGNFGVMATLDLILKYRQTILNIEQLIINDKRISELFMMVW